MTNLELRYRQVSYTEYQSAYSSYTDCTGYFISVGLNHGNLLIMGYWHSDAVTAPALVCSVPLKTKENFCYSRPTVQSDNVLLLNIGNIIYKLNITLGRQVIS